jgi:hypothetical protein
MKNITQSALGLISCLLLSPLVLADITGQLTLTDSSGVMAPTYQSGQSVYIRIEDSDGNANANSVERLTVTITSETEDSGTPFSATNPVAAGSNVGDGTLTALTTSYDTKTEDWSVLAVSASSFLVTGSVSGQQSQQYSINSDGIPYVSDNNEVSFVIENNTVAFSVGDTITFSTSAGTIVGEAVTLTETGVDSGMFTSSITLNEAVTPNAATVIRGSTLLADTIWTEGNSPYLVTGDVTVSVNTTLTIMPGVTVLFLANTDDTVGGQSPYDSELIIQGSLNVAGTASKGVTLTSSNRESAIGDWGGCSS